MPSSLTDKQRKTVSHSLRTTHLLIVFRTLYIRRSTSLGLKDFLWQVSFGARRATTISDFPQMHRPLVIPLRTVLGYLLRFVFCLVTMELILHVMYVVAIKDARAWAYDSPPEIAMLGFWNLIQSVVEGSSRADLEHWGIDVYLPASWLLLPWHVVVVDRQRRSSRKYAEMYGE
jgi:hypothetical protein